MKNSKFIKAIGKAAIFISCGLLCACTLTPEAKLARAYKRTGKTPFPEWPVLYVQLEREGLIDSATREKWQKAWEVRQKREIAERIAEEKRQEEACIAAEKAQRKAQEKRRRWWESLTPGQQMQYEMQQQQMAFQEQQQQMAFQSQQQQMAFQSQQQRQAAIQAGIQNIQQSAQQQMAATQAANQNFTQGIQQQQQVDAYNRRTQVLSQPININQNVNFRSY